MKSKIFLAIIFLMLGFNSFAHKKKIKKGNKKTKTVTVKPPIPASVMIATAKPLMLCNTHYGMPTWYLSMIKNFTFPTKMLYPANYRLLQINDADLITYLQTIPYEKSKQKVQIPLFIDNQINCVEFSIERVQTMDEALQAKYPQLMSFKVYEEMNLLNAGRIDCDENSTKFSINYNGHTYFVTPVTFENKVYYVAYSKNDPNLIKSKFE